MKKISLVACSAVMATMLLTGCNNTSADSAAMALPDSVVVNIDKVDPPCWYVGMKNPSLQVMLYGQGVGNASTAVTDYAGVKVDSVVHLDSKNYLLVYMNVAKAQPGTVNLNLVFDNCKQPVAYELRARDMAPEARMGFDAGDVLYMLMPDRFANGDPTNDNIEGMKPYKVDREQPSARHGGDIKGIEDHLDYFNELGVTALWFTPLLENDMSDFHFGDRRQSCYHGYATTDYYAVDPRFGSNDDYRRLIDKAHEKGLKIVMDMIFNHCGSDHVWLTDMPSKDWFNNPDYENNFVQTSYKLTPHVDPYASQYDFSEMNDGWFVLTMPDLNQRNPHVTRYLIQNSFWWIETVGIDGIRMDTHPYAYYDAMSQWLKELNEEYPNFNVVGETWCENPAFTAWWQKDSKLSAPLNSNLKSVMDFHLWQVVNNSLTEETDSYMMGLNKVYHHFVYDYLYPDPSSVMAFVENHDTDRFLRNGENIDALKQAMVLLLTTRRIPQLYYGTEVMMNGTKEVTDGYVRKDFPGGWEGDKRNLFNAEERNAKEAEMFNFLSNILHWRKGNDVIAKGDLKHFIPQQGVYAYARSYEGKTVFVLLNGCDKAVDLRVKPYAEVLGDAKQGRDVISGNVVEWDTTIALPARGNMIIEL